MGRIAIKEEESDRKRKTWRWPLATLVVVFLAVAVSPRTASKVGFFFTDRNSCSCSLQVKLWCDCPFWPDDGMCRLRDCSVCECPESEFPEPFKRPLPSDDLKCQEGKPQAAVDRTIDNRA